VTLETRLRQDRRHLKRSFILHQNVASSLITVNKISLTRAYRFQYNRTRAEICSLLEERRLLLKSGTIVYATIIAAPQSAKNEQKVRDPEMHQTKKGKDWQGMKAHIGSDGAASFTA
jgi:hypothetical protein